MSASGVMLGPCAGRYDGRDHRGYDLRLQDGLTAAQAVELYRADLLYTFEGPSMYPDEAELRTELLEALAGLRGKNLACWCPILDDRRRGRQPCHADVLLELVNGPWLAGLLAAA